MECQVLKGVYKGEDWMAKRRRKPLVSRSMAVIVYSFHHLISTSTVTLASKLLTVLPYAI
jgi:hypothetical protein